MSLAPPTPDDLSPGPGAPEPTPDEPWFRGLRALVKVERGEVAAMLWSAALFFTVLCSYYVIRPLREAMGLTGGVKALQWMFSATFVAMLLAVPLFSAMVARWPRQVFIPWVFRGFGLQLLGFFAALQLASGAAEVAVARIFYVWAAVFSLFVVSVFWEYMADLWRRDQGERLFGFIAAGGTAGALFGPLLAGRLAEWIGPDRLILLTVLGLEVAVLCVHRLGRLAARSGGQAAAGKDALIGGSIFAGFTLALASPRLLGICGYVLLLAITGTFVYFEQMHIVEPVVQDLAARTVLFANIDLAVNVTALILQLAVVGRLMPAIGLGWTLAILPLVSLAGFITLGVAPVFWVIIVAGVARRAADYALAKPAREVLFTQVGREAKYKAKNFIDTVVYRGGDAVAAWTFAGAQALGLGLSGLALLAAPIAALWVVAAFLLGRGTDERRPRSPGRSRP
jgi:AAA family ATP:ADP antiporter